MSTPENTKKNSYPLGKVRENNFLCVWGQNCDFYFVYTDI